MHIQVCAALVACFYELIFSPGSAAKPAQQAAILYDPDSADDIDDDDPDEDLDI